MKPVVVDFETYYDPEYSLSKMTTEAYVRDERFETILCGFKVGNKAGYWIPAEWVPDELEKLQLAGHAVIAHHAHFDGLILSHHYGVKPELWVDTLSMARALHGAKAGNSLATLCKRYGLKDKGDEVVRAMGKRRRDFSTYELRSYGEYCVNDCEREAELAKLMAPSFCAEEIKLIDAYVRMFTEPVLQLNREALLAYKERLRVRKVQLLVEAGVQLGDLRSNEKFAEVLRFVGIDPPMKYNDKGKLIYAFAKKDEAMIELADHPDEAVQAIIAARLNARSTINESRTERLLDMETRGPACVYITYYAAHSGRAGGGDKTNWQNMERVAYDKQKVQTHGFIRTAVEAPDGHVLVVGDSSNIEARLLDWTAGQEDQVEAYRAYDAGRGPDIYCVMAEKIYGRPISKKDDPDERFDGKTAKLGLGYGTGDKKLAATARKPLTWATNVVNIYRKSHPAVVKLWRRADECLGLIANGKVGIAMDHRGIVRTCEEGLLLPNGMKIKYRNLKKNESGDWTYFDGKSVQKIYGAKVVENVIQALARIVVMSQCLMVPRRLVLSVHDEGVWITKERNAEKVKAEVTQALRTPLPWCLDLPLNCEVGYHKVYGKAKQ